MQKEEAYFLHLLSGYIDDSLSKQQVQELFDLISSDRISSDHLLNHPEIKEKLETLATQGRQEIPDLVSNRMRDRLLAAIEFSEIQRQIPVIARTRVRNMFFSRAAAVAMILLVIAPATYLFLQSRKPKSITTEQTATTLNEITAGNHKPVLTLSGGQQIILDSSANKSLSAISNTNIAKAKTNELAYQNGTTAEIIYNTLTNPRGSTVATLTLSDGTRVWLNAGSSVTYPVAFNTSNRDVEITGEAYFEVTKNPHRPFTVKKKNSDTRVTVLGTHFDVNMYDDESEDKITLLEGAVNVTTATNSRRLSPNEQAVVNKEQIALAKSVNLESVMAWKNGQFLLKGTDLAQLLRQISRWYDVDIENKNTNSNIKFGGSIARNVNLSTVVEALKINGVNCKLNGKKLMVESN